jgi:3-hydroxymyristoyl/3-hydroxydecanoyl-(acyl carrier protein) dehydratase
MTASDTPLTSTTREIQKHMPHRYPFFLIDRMVGCEPGRWVKVIKNVSNNDQFFAGIPPRERVMPEMLVFEALAQAAGVLCHYSGMVSRIGSMIIFLAGSDYSRFGRGVVPGEQILFECEMVRKKSGVAKLNGRAMVGDEVVLESQLTAVIRDGSELMATP